jgi:hypothetical protein
MSDVILKIGANTTPVILYIYPTNVNSLDKTVSTWQDTPDNSHIPSEKLVKDSITSVTNTVADGVYTVGKGTAQDGKITISGGIITAIQQASNA